VQEDDELFGGDGFRLEARAVNLHGVLNLLSLLALLLQFCR
jgi:hypothetical protein